LVEDWPGDNDWPGMFQRLKIENIGNDDTDESRKHNFRGSKACYDGVTWICKHKSSTLKTKFQKEVVRYFLQTCERKSGDSRFAQYEYFLVEVKNSDLLAWMEDYRREKTQEEVERRDNRDWNSRTGDVWCRLNHTARLGKPVNAHGIPILKKNEEHTYKSMSNHNTQTGKTVFGAACERYYNGPDNEDYWTNPAIAKIQRATPWDQEYSRSRFNLPTDCYLENLDDTNPELRRFCSCIQQKAPNDLPEKIPKWIKIMYRFRYWLAFMSTVEELEMEWDTKLLETRRTPRLNELEKYSKLRAYAQHHPNYSVFVPAANVCANPYLLDLL
jgi:hypothetical protein